MLQVFGQQMQELPACEYFQNEDVHIPSAKKQRTDESTAKDEKLRASTWFFFKVRNLENNMEYELQDALFKTAKEGPPKYVKVKVEQKPESGKVVASPDGTATWQVRVQHGSSGNFDVIEVSTQKKVSFNVSVSSKTGKGNQRDVIADARTQQVTTHTRTTQSKAPSRSPKEHTNYKQELNELKERINGLQAGVSEIRSILASPTFLPSILHPSLHVPPPVPSTPTITNTSHLHSSTSLSSPKAVCPTRVRILVSSEALPTEIFVHDFNDLCRAISYLGVRVSDTWRKEYKLLYLIDSLPHTICDNRTLMRYWEVGAISTLPVVLVSQLVKIACDLQGPVTEVFATSIDDVNAEVQRIWGTDKFFLSYNGRVLDSTSLTQYWLMYPLPVVIVQFLDDLSSSNSIPINNNEDDQHDINDQISKWVTGGFSSPHTLSNTQQTTTTTTTTNITQQNNFMYKYSRILEILTAFESLPALAIIPYTENDSGVESDNDPVSPLPVPDAADLETPPTDVGNCEATASSTNSPSATTFSPVVLPIPINVEILPKENPTSATAKPHSSAASESELEIHKTSVKNGSDSAVFPEKHHTLDNEIPDKDNEGNLGSCPENNTHKNSVNMKRKNVEPYKQRSKRTHNSADATKELIQVLKANNVTHFRKVEGAKWRDYARTAIQYDVLSQVSERWLEWMFANGLEVLIRQHAPLGSSCYELLVVHKHIENSVTRCLHFKNKTSKVEGETLCSNSIQSMCSEHYSNESELAASVKPIHDEAASFPTMATQVEDLDKPFSSVPSKKLSFSNISPRYFKPRGESVTTPLIPSPDYSRYPFINYNSSNVHTLVKSARSKFK